MNDRYFYKSKGYYYIGFNYNASFVSYMKQMKALYNIANKEWYLEPTLCNIDDILFFLKTNNFREIKKNEVSRSCKIRKIKVKEFLSKSDIQLFLPELKLNGTLRDYQIDILHYMVNHGNCINGSDCGTGKTRTIISYCELLDVFPVLIICPSTVKLSWRNEWTQVNPNRSLSIIDARNKNNDFSKDVVIINYDLLGNKKNKTIEVKFKELLVNKYKGIVADEIHFLKNPKSIRSKAFEKISTKIKVRLGLSGTIITNRPSELINILILLGRFDIFPNYMYYIQRYCNAKKTMFGWDITDNNNLKELHELLDHYCYVRKEKRDVLKELPPLTEQYIECELTNKKIYQKAEKKFIEYLITVDVTRIDAALRAEHLVKLNELRKLSIDGKLKIIQIFIKEWLESNENEKLIVFGCLKEPLQKLHTSIDDSLLITGENSLKEKETILKEFCFGEKQILLANMQCIGTGVDGLQNVCSNAVIIEFPMKPTDLEQTISRLERSGQKNNINIYYLMSNQTIDMKIWQILQQKKNVTDIVNRGSESDLSLSLIKSYKPIVE